MAADAGRTSWDRAINVATLLVLVGVVAMAFGPDGVARHYFDRRRAVAQQRAGAREVAESISVRLSAEQDPGGTGQLVLIEVADYQCPYCRTMQPRLEALVASKKVARVYQVHYPLSTHPQARGAALAAICADSVGGGEAMHRILYARDEWYNEPRWTELAALAGVGDTASVARCVAGQWALKRLANDSALALRLGVRATPTFVFGDKLHVGAMSAPELEAFITQ